MEQKSVMPLVSVIVPFYNIEENQMKECLSSIWNQTYDQLELIIVDDGSESRYARALDSYASLAPYETKTTKVIHKKNAGVSSARNLGIERASGEYILFVDGDDFIEKECVEDAVKHMQNTQVDVVFWNYRKCFTNHEALVLSYEEDELMYDKDRKEFRPFDMSLIGTSCVKMYKRALIGEERFRESLSHGEDVEFNFRVFSHLKSALFLNKVYYNYRIQHQSTVRGFREDMIEVYDETLNYVEEDIQNAKMHRKELRQAYRDFVAICYLMVNLNHIFAKEMKATHFHKMRMLRELSSRHPYKEVIQVSNRLRIPMTRKMALVFAKWHFYEGVGMIMKVKEWMDR